METAPNKLNESKTRRIEESDAEIASTGEPSSSSSSNGKKNQVITIPTTQIETPKSAELRERVGQFIDSVTYGRLYSFQENIWIVERDKDGFEPSQYGVYDFVADLSGRLYPSSKKRKNQNINL